MQLTEQQAQQLYGEGVDTTTVVIAMVLVAGLTALVKIIFASKGKVSFLGITLQWGK